MSLKQAYASIKAGDKASAVQLLLPILQTDESNASAWWLMANALSEPDDIREALEKVLQFRPDHEPARKKLDKLNKLYPPKPKTDDDLAFIFDDDDYVEDTRDDFFDALEYDDGMPGARRQAPARAQKSGNNTLVIVLATVGVMALLAIAACVVLPMIGVSILGNAVEDVYADMLGELENGEFTIETGASSGSVDNTTFRGTLQRGDTRYANVDTWVDDSWTFTANAGDRLSILITAQDHSLDPELFLYDSAGNMVAQNDDIDLAGGNYDSRVDVSLNYSDTYTIVVSAFGQGGPYQVILN